MAKDTRVPNLTLENVQIRFRNFSGKEGKFNAEGQRNFCVLLDPEQATQMIEQGWNIKQLKPREEGDAPQDYIKVKISYREGQRPPAVTLINSRGRTSLGESEIDILDWADIKNTDLVISPYYWTTDAGAGITAYLVRVFITINEDELELKYADVPSSAQNSMPVGPRFEVNEEDNYND